MRARRFLRASRCSTHIVVVLAMAGAGLATTVGDVSAATVQAAAPVATAAPLVAGDPAWLNRINAIRTAAGLQPVTNDPDWTLGIQQHLTYLTDTDPSLETGQYASAHTENPASPYYTADGALEGSRSDLTSGSTDDLGAVNGWLAAPFHAIGILRPTLRQVAFARDADTGEAGLDVISGLSGPAATSPVLFPGPGSTINLSQYSSGEVPNPLESCASKAGSYSHAGLPLIALLTQAPSAGLSASLTLPGGSVATSSSPDLCIVDQTTYTSSDPVYGPNGASTLAGDYAVLLVPRVPLVAGQYTATISQPGKADITWSFTSAPVTSPGKPTGVRFTTGDGQVTMSWTAPADTGGEPLDGYDISGDGEHFDLAHDTSPTTSRTVTGLTNGVQYKMCVAAFNTVIEGAGTCVFPTPQVPQVLAAPTGVVATAGDGQATVSWTTPTNTTSSPITGYDLESSSNDGADWDGTSAAFHTNTATTENVTGLTNGTSYVFRVGALTANAPGPFSALSAAVTPHAVVPPMISSVAPAVGSVSGGTVLTLLGTGFTGAIQVAFGTGINGSGLNVVSDTKLQVTTPAHAAGIVNVRVTTPAATSAVVSADQFTFESGPVITGVSPASGPLAGGNTVTITGSGFAGVSQLMFGNGAPATSFTVVSESKITATAPAHAPGAVNVKLTTPVGTSAVVAADQYSFAVAPPVIAMISPKSGSTAGGDTVTISGTGFAGTSKVLFGNGFPAASFEVNPAGTQITAVSPAHVAGAVNVKVTAPGGTSATVTADQFTFKAPPPVITGVFPATGPISGGTVVTISGSGFTGATTVVFGNGDPAATFTVSADGTQITATAPAHAAGAVNIKITTGSGTSATVTDDRFTYATAT